MLAQDGREGLPPALGNLEVSTVAFWSILEGLRETHVAYGFVHVRRRIRARVGGEWTRQRSVPT